ncbi:unnamed protein product, partial [Staurois parvus]
MSFTLVVSGKNVPYIGGQWEECPLHWWSVGRMLLTLVASGENVLTSVGKMFFTLVVSGKNDLYIGGYGKNVPYSSGQWEECPLLVVRRLPLQTARKISLALAP